MSVVTAETVAIRRLAAQRVQASAEVRRTLTLEVVEGGTGRILAELPEQAPDGQICFEPGDVLFGKLRPYLAKSVLVREKLHGSGEFLTLTPGSEMDSRYLFYTTLSADWLRYAEETSYGLKMPRTSWDAMADFRMACPPLAVQRAIADFLDYQVARISSAIAGREQQMRLLGEAQAAHVSERVALLLSAAAGHKLRFLAHEIDLRAGSATSSDLLSVSIHHGVVPRSELTQDAPRADDLGNYKVVLPGDLVLNRMRAFQGAIGVAATHGVVSPDYCVLRCGPRLNSGFAHFLFRSDWFVGEMVSRLRGIGSADLGAVRTPRVNVEDLLDIEVPCPDLEEQALVLHDLGESQAIDRQRIDVLQRSLALLKEYKLSLITAAVAGEFDVSTDSGRGIPA